MQPQLPNNRYTPAYLASQAGADRIDVAELERIIGAQAELAHYPNASAIDRQVVIYEAEKLLAAARTDRTAVLNELNALLMDGPGIFVIRGAYASDVIDRHSAVLSAIIEAETANRVAADHFAKAGANRRLWNALQKSALRSPASFVEYYANSLIALAAEAWLGPHYQITAQVNVVLPGGAAQEPHRDYHLGFMTEEQAQRYPMSMQVLSQALTLQGAVAHSDMPIESGPTLLLPHSQRYDLGYLAWRREPVRRLFAEHAVQLPLRKGDMLYFNPAVMHAAGSNRTTDFERFGNLFQISSALGRAMETVDRDAVTLAIYPELLSRVEAGRLDDEALQCVIAASAEGYAFPTNLDTDPPIGGLAPQSSQQTLHQAIAEHWSFERFEATVKQMANKRLA